MSRRRVENVVEIGTILYDEPYPGLTVTEIVERGATLPLRYSTTARHLAAMHRAGIVGRANRERGQYGYYFTPEGQARFDREVA